MVRSSLLLFALALSLACGSDSGAEDEVLPDPDAEMFCFIEDCFDDDICTDDFCGPDGSCIHVPRNAFDACQTAAHCDDEDPCTIDSCALDECGLMRCKHEWQEGCQSCAFGGWCDDQNPCTADVCGEDGICAVGDTDPHCDPMCRQDIARTVDEAQWMWPQGETISWFSGVADSNRGATCEGSACVCDGELVLGSAGFDLPLRQGSGLEDEPLSCSIEACELHRATCTPLMQGVGYVAWGIMRHQNAFGGSGEGSGAAQDTFVPSDAGAPQAPPIDAFEIQGFCLSTRLEHATGRYDAIFESDGQRATFGLTLEIGADGAAHATMQECTGCIAIGLVTDQDIVLERSIGDLSMPLALTTGLAHVRLYAARNRFVGDVVTRSGRFVGVLTLERVAP